jgi:hypothetical protein
MRFIFALVLSLAAAVTAAPQNQAGTGTIAARQQCTVDCTCLNTNGNRSWPDTQRCCAPNGGTLDTPVCGNSPSLPLKQATNQSGLSTGRPSIAAVSPSIQLRLRLAVAAAGTDASNAEPLFALSKDGRYQPGFREEDLKQRGAELSHVHGHSIFGFVMRKIWPTDCYANAMYLLLVSAGLKTLSSKQTVTEIIKGYLKKMLSSLTNTRIFTFS